jgi:hypothetical protein
MLWAKRLAKASRIVGLHLELRELSLLLRLHLRRLVAGKNHWWRLGLPLCRCLLRLGRLGVSALTAAAPR